MLSSLIKMSVPDMMDLDTTESTFTRTKDKVSVSCLSQPVQSSTVDSRASSIPFGNDEIGHPSYSIFINSLEKEFHIPKGIDQLHGEFLESYELAYEESKISMLPIFEIPHSFNPSQGISGEYLVIDIGGSTIRIGIIDFQSESKRCIKLQNQWILKEDEKIIDHKFFENLVKKAIEQIKYNDNDNDAECSRTWEIGMTWSFPLNETNEIITMGKGFHITEEVTNVGLDKLIAKEFARQGVSVRINSIINDSIAVNLSGLINSRDFHSQISLILGTGLNSCITVNDNTLINTELGFFGKLETVTKYDALIDQRWSNGLYPKPYLKNDESGNGNVFMPLEFLTSGRYITEMLRLIIIDLIQQDFLTSFDIREFNDPFSLHGGFIVAFNQSKPHTEIQSDINEQFSIDITVDEIKLLQRIIDIILTRSSIYITASIKALSSFINTSNSSSASTQSINVNYIGSFLYHCQELQNKIKSQSQDEIILNHIDDSSLLGAAVAACLKSHI